MPATAASPAAGLNVRDLHVDFGALAALRQVSFEVGAGEFVTIVGPTGCGKTTLLRVIAGLTRPTQGDVHMNGHRVEGPGPERGMVFQEYALFPWLTVRQNIDFGPRVRGVEARLRSDKVDEYLGMVGLQGFQEYRPRQLSGGMKQRAAIARALVNEPAVLLMDEPFGSLDAQSRCDMQSELLRIWEHARPTIVFVTHSVEEAVFLADRAIILSARPGSVVATVPIDLPRPRVRTDPEFNAVRAEIMTLIQPPENHRIAATGRAEGPKGLG